MSPEPDETQVMPVIGGRTPILERLLHEVEGDLSRLTHHRRYHRDESPATPTTAAMEAPRMSTILSDVHKAVTEGITNIEGWASDLKDELPKLADLATKYENNPIVAELEKLGDLVLPPEVVQGVVGLIQMGGKLVAGAASAVDAPAAPAAPAEPVAAVPAA